MFKAVLKVLRRVPNTRNVGTVKMRLNIAYFGSDKFSIHSLKKLVEYHRKNPDKVSSIDVITRSIKPTGRNLKTFVDVPIGEYCEEEKLNIHRADSSDDIMNVLSKNQFNLAIAVSYGKLIPEGFLKSMQYGGLNVHPSLLPKYSGSSPLQYALMNDDDFTGVTVQTLHPSKFDKGEIVLQSNPIPIAETDNYDSLGEKLGEHGSRLLLNVIDNRLFEQPTKIEESPYRFSLASKIKPSQSEIRWDILTSRKIKRLNDALGQLHSYKFCDIRKKKKDIKETQKVIFNDIELFNDFPGESLQPGEFILDENNNKLIIKTIDSAISIGKLKFQYCSEEDPKTFMSHLTKRSGDTSHKFLSRT